MRILLAAAALGLLLPSAPSLASAGTPVYDSEGRRDPFRPASDEHLRERDCPQDGSVKALRADEVRLRELVRTPAGPAALIDGPGRDGTSLARVADALCDGRVEAIDYENRLVVLRVARRDPLRPWRERILRLETE